MFQETLNGVSRKSKFASQLAFEWALGVLQGSLCHISKKFKGCIKKCLNVFLKVLGVLQENFNGVECFIEVSRPSKGGVSRKFQRN